MDLSPPSRLFLGASLQSLTLNLNDKSNTASAINHAIVIVSRLQFLKKLHLFLPNFFPDMSFSPFAVAPQLQDLGSYAPAGQPSHSHLDQLRRLSHMHRMSVVNVSNDALPYLLRAPHSLQWQEIHRVDAVEDDEAAALSNLPTLTKLNTSDCRSVAFLPMLTDLCTLLLDMDSDVALAAEIVAGLPLCSQLTDLSLTLTM